MLFKYIFSHLYKISIDNNYQVIIYIVDNGYQLYISSDDNGYQVQLVIYW